ncbi:putative GPI-anchored protein pfl2 [Strongylocentrotus purpuratus]|uniref:DUF4371 domain-containing protein n=1 Tax=Strongylocentrotus purpuratus TaxID=7668 RepID=A0A7M7NID2_STRPU|nr:putative GPI-anchored protein pfl2 [Strongylocentrotus purpuratus]
MISQTKPTYYTYFLVFFFSTEDVVKKLRTRPFSISTDGSSDRGAQEQLYPIIVRYYDDEHVVSSLLEISSTKERSTGKNIFLLLDKALKEYSIPWSNVIGYSADNASVMMGQVSGVAAFIQKFNPDTFINGCLCHRLHLAGEKGAKELAFCPGDLLIKIYYYLEKSSKRNKEFRETQRSLHVADHVILKYICTRWLSLEASLGRLLEQWEPLLVYFREEAQTRCPSAAPAKKSVTSTTKQPSSSVKSTTSTTKQASSSVKSTTSTTKQPSSSVKSTTSTTKQPSSSVKSTTSTTKQPSSSVKSTTSTTKQASSSVKSTTSTTKQPSSSVKSTTSTTKQPSSSIKSTSSTTKQPSSSVKPTSSTTKQASTSVKGALVNTLIFAGEKLRPHVKAGENVSKLKRKTDHDPAPVPTKKSVSSTSSIAAMSAKNVFFPSSAKSIQSRKEQTNLLNTPQRPRYLRTVEQLKIRLGRSMIN